MLVNKDTHDSFLYWSINLAALNVFKIRLTVHF